MMSTRELSGEPGQAPCLLVDGIERLNPGTLEPGWRKTRGEQQDDMWIQGINVPPR